MVSFTSASHNAKISDMLSKLCSFYYEEDYEKDAESSISG